ncbi:MAG: glycoside hydrolase family 32 protein [Clostridia bacterium]|nr:glycoside hydrolase family 32 protein [Clostridia bacterium]MBO5078028.1 glycoside hydrolase family 32 protein [Clostridia bacterium]
MLTNNSLKYHFHPAKGWINDPNGLSYFKGKYHIFYQNQPDVEYPCSTAIWGHAVTENFRDYEELPPALVNDRPYDRLGVWSGTAIEYGGMLYAFYASVTEQGRQTISVARSEDGFHFEKYAGNPVVSEHPAETGNNFRDPAVMKDGDRVYMVVASADTERHSGTLLLYVSDNCFDWKYIGVLREYPGARFCECPSFIKYGEGYILSVSVDTGNGHYFEVLYGNFDGLRFAPEIVSHFQKGPDEYAGQIFLAPDGRAILMSWIPGWQYQPKQKCIGCLSLPLELTVDNASREILAYPIAEVRDLVSADGTVNDAYVKETYVDRGREVYIELTSVPDP